MFFVVRNDNIIAYSEYKDKLVKILPNDEIIENKEITSEDCTTYDIKCLNGEITIGGQICLDYAQSNTSNVIEEMTIETLNKKISELSSALDYTQGMLVDLILTQNEVSE